MSQDMQDTQVQTSSESQLTDTPVQTAISKSSFDNAEYERWSQNLRNRMASKGK